MASRTFRFILACAAYNFLGLACAEVGFQGTGTPPQVSVVKVLDVTVQPDASVEVPIYLDAIGREGGISFSLRFDPNYLRFDGVACDLVPCPTNNFIVNSNLFRQGEIGVGVKRDPDESFPTGRVKVVTAVFRSGSVQLPVATPISFINHPTEIEVADATAHILDGHFLNGTVLIQPSGSVIGSCEPACLRGLRLVESPSSANERVVSVRLSMQGDEKQINSSIAFDAAKVEFMKFTTSISGDAGHLFVYSEAGILGAIGLSLDVADAAGLPSGEFELACFTFRALDENPGGLKAYFTNAPIALLTLDGEDRILPTSYLGTPWEPPLGIYHDNGGLIIQWRDFGAAGFALEYALALGAEWNTVAAVPSTNLGLKVLSIPATNSSGWFRLRRQ